MNAALDITDGVIYEGVLENCFLQLLQCVNAITIWSRKSKQTVTLVMQRSRTALYTLLIVSAGEQCERRSLSEISGDCGGVQGLLLCIDRFRGSIQRREQIAAAFSGCNLFVNNGAGSTASIVGNSAGEGLGNLIIGYNVTGHRIEADVRTGSHNLIIGDDQNYTSYGGLVAGRFSNVTAPYASVSNTYGWSGGSYNTP